SYHAASSYLSKLQVKLTAFGYDPREEVAHKYGVQGLPTSYFIDARGVIVRPVAGQLTKSIMESGAQAALGGGAIAPYGRSMLRPRDASDQMRAGRQSSDG